MRFVIEYESPSIDVVEIGVDVITGSIQIPDIGGSDGEMEW